VLKNIAPLFAGEVINVSGWNDQDKEGSCYQQYFVNAKSYSVSNYDGERGVDEARDTTTFYIDLTKPIPSPLINKFDVVLNHTTLEHIFDVNTAFGNLCALSSDAVIIIVPFAQPVHYTNSYGDYWRFNPMSLRELFSRNKMEVVFEAANDHENAGIYLLFVGSKYPEKWRSKLPAWEPICELGDWIGSDPPNLKQRTRRIMVELIRKARSHLQSLLITLTWS
jgi:hypothetical protein